LPPAAIELELVATNLPVEMVPVEKGKMGGFSKARMERACPGRCNLPIAWRRIDPKAVD
jgi:hypothetical protein